MYRARRMVRRRWWRLLDRQAPQTEGVPAAGFHSLFENALDVSSTGPWHEAAESSILSGRAAARGVFEFLSHRVRFDGEPNWHDQRVSQLWRYQLHYGDYLIPWLVWAAHGESELAWSAFRKTVCSWIEGNRLIRGDGWHPFTISVRLVNWLEAACFFKSRIDDDEAFARLFYRSVHGQAGFLFHDLELDVRGNHLLKNLKALIHAGTAFEDPAARRFKCRALALLEEEVGEQVLGDGGHFERSPGYHLIVMRDMFETALVLRRNDGQAPAWLEAGLKRMLDYLMTIRPPDGNPPLLKDTARDAAPSISDMLAVGALYFGDPAYKIDGDFGLYPVLLFGSRGWVTFRRWPIAPTGRGSASLPYSGHFVLRDDAAGDHLIFDAGKPCPDYLPAHCHADLLSYELMAGNRRVVVDSGVFEYAAGQWRDFFRSTRAHNTVEVAGENQSEVWSSFRVARRARPGLCTFEESPDHVLVSGMHDGYRRLRSPLTHRRAIFWRKGVFWMILDELAGSSEVRAMSHIHLHPDLDFQWMGGVVWKIASLPEPLFLTAFGTNGHQISRGEREPDIQGWYSERFGEKTENSVLSLFFSGKAPVRCGYVLSKTYPASAKAGLAPGDSTVKLEYDTREYSILLPGAFRRIQ